MGRVLDCVVDGGVAARALVEAALLHDGLGRAVRVQLIGRLRVEPGNGAAQAKTLRRDHAAVRRCEGLTEDAGEEAVDGFVGHGGQTVVTHVVARDGDVVQKRGGLDRIGNQVNLALVDDSVKFICDHVVQNLGKVRQAQALVIGVLGNTDTELVALAGVHDAFHIVEPGVDLALDHRLEIGLHLLARDIDAGGKRVFQIAGVDIRAVDDELVILDLVHVLHENKLAGGVLCGPELDLHVGLTDDLALECSCECNGDGQLLGLDLDAAQLQRLLDRLIMVGAGLQCARNLIFAEVDIDHDREAQRDCACTRGNDDIVDRTEGIDERGNALLGVLEQARQIARLHVAEDQRGTDGDGDDMDDGGHIMAQRDDAELKAHLDARFRALFNDFADHEGHDALGLIVLDDLCNFLAVFGLAQHDGHTGDIARDQRHAEGTDDGIGHEADAGNRGLLIGILRFGKLQALKDLGTDSGGQTGVECLSQILLIGDEALEHAHAGGQIAQSLDLDAGGGVDGGEEIRGVREGNGMVCAIFCNGVVDCTLGQTSHGMRAAIDEIG